MKLPHQAWARRLLALGPVALAVSAAGGALAVSAGATTARPKAAHAPVLTASRLQVAPGIFAERLPSARSIDIAHDTVTLPLHKGRTPSGETVWYVVTDSSSHADARRRGVNYAGKLNNARGTAAVQAGHLARGTLVFSGTVNFAHKRVLIPGPNGFPPKRYAPGPRADARYSPLVRVGNGPVLNAPQVANRTGVGGSVVAINYRQRTVTLSLLAGWVDGQFTVYLHTDASSPLIAALEDSTYTPNLNAAPGIGSDEPPSSRAAIIPVINGPQGDANPQRQGLQSALLGQGDPFNVAQEQPSDPIHYTPVWDVTPVKWTDAAIAAGKRMQLHSQDDVRQQVQAGNLISALPGTPNHGLGGVNAIGAISNCPIIAVFPG
jgi:hypothetical protein